jgi:hypothetical protein
MNKQDIKDHYQNLRDDVRNAQTSKALRLLQYRSSGIVRDLSGPEVKSSLKKQALREHRKTLNAIKSRTKQLK